MTASASGPEVSSPDSRPPPAHHPGTSRLDRFRGARRISRKIAPYPPPLTHTKCKTWNRILPLLPSIDNHALDRLPAASGVWKSKAMFAGTESSTSIPTPARLRIFGLAAYTHRSLNGNVLEAGLWFATELVKFDSYGAAPGAMPRPGFALGPAPPVPSVFRRRLEPCPRGGLAVVRILLLLLRGHQEPPCYK